MFANTSSNGTGDCSGLVPNLIPEVVATDNCTIASTTQSPLAGTSFGSAHNDAIWVTITVTDIYGNASTCQVKLTLKDDENPTIDCSVIPTALNNTAGECHYFVPGFNLNPTYADNCGPLTLTNSLTGNNTLGGTTLAVGSTSVTWTVTDANGNAAACSVTYVVTDNEVPVARCQGPFIDVVLDGDGLGQLLVADVNNDSWDNCGALTRTEIKRTEGANGTALGTVVYFSCADALNNSHPVVLEIQDQHGNISRCTTQVDVYDLESPVITCPNGIETVTDAGLCTAVVNGIALQDVNDNCPVAITYAITGATVKVGSTDASGTVFNKGFSTVTYTVVDMDGNKATCSFTVTVKCPPDPPAFPCDSLVVTKSKVDSGVCCFSVNFNVHAGPVAYVEAESLTPGVTFSSPNLSSSFAFAGLPSSTLISIKHNPFKGIPQGNYPNALQFCLNNITQVPQMVIFRWYAYGPSDVPYLACTDTLLFECGGPCANNLVPNPSFEQFTACPPGVAPPFMAAIWSLPSVGGSSDYYNSCAPAASYVSTPGNGFGTQVPRTGSGYAGFILRPTNLYREYLEVQLTTPLVAGNTYQVSFYVSLADQSKWAIDKFGAYLSVGSVGPINGAPVLPFVPQVVH